MGISIPTSDNCDYFFYLRLSPMCNPKVVNTRATSHTDGEISAFHRVGISVKMKSRTSYMQKREGNE